MAAADPAVEGVQGVLLKLRTHAGLTVRRLGVTEVNVTLLAELPAIRDLIGEGLPVEDAIVSAVRTVAGQLGPSDLLIADAALALGVVADRTGPGPAVDGLTAADLGERRKALAANWDELHALLDATPPPKPSVRNLRGAIESRTLRRLAELCVGPATDTASAQTIAPPRGAELEADEPDPDDTDDGVVVVGGAVMDRIFMVNEFAAPNTSIEAITYNAHPGGKGLNLAVAAARMGLVPRLISAVGDDHDAQRVLTYMRERHLPTRHIKRTRGAETPVTAVIVAADGRSSNIGWRNIAVRRTEDELDRLRSVIAGAEAVIVTFEPSFGEVDWALRTVADSKPKPLLVVQPSPRLDSPQLLYPYLPFVDYLVGAEHDLRDLLGPVAQELTFNEVAGRLYNAGANAICAVDNLTCRVRAEGFFTTVKAPEGPMTEAPAARERFAAALVHQLLNYGHDLTEEKLKWAAAAMAPQARPDEITDAMPDPSEVDELLDATKAWRK